MERAARRAFRPSDPKAVDWKAAYRKDLESRFPTPSSLRLYLQEIEKRTPDPILCCFELNPEECHRRVLAAFIREHQPRRSRVERSAA
ncbi:MAG: DUF488 family protein [Bilophila wadsworthia]